MPNRYGMGRNSLQYWQYCEQQNRFNLAIDSGPWFHKPFQLSSACQRLSTLREISAMSNQVYETPNKKIKMTKSSLFGWKRTAHQSEQPYHCAICNTLRFQVYLGGFLKTILIWPVRGHHAMETTTPCGKSFFLRDGNGVIKREHKVCSCSLLPVQKL